VERPDREWPGQGGCDAVLNRGGARQALEHTTLDSTNGGERTTIAFERLCCRSRPSLSRRSLTRG
jgi:hypothetical protein